MYCRYCGKANKDEAQFCCYCGKSFKENMPPNQATRQESEPHQIEQSPVKKGKSKILFILGLLAASAVLCVAVLFVVKLFVSRGQASGDLVMGSEWKGEDQDDNTHQSLISRQLEGGFSKNSVPSTAQLETSTRPESTYTAEQTSVVKPSETTTSSSLRETSVSGREHSYKFVVGDYTWEEAYRKCKDMGGYLVRFETDAEYLKLVSQLYAEGHQKIRFWIGARRDPSATSYHWVANDGSLMGVDLTGAQYQDKWMKGEPSFYDSRVAVDEAYMNIFYYTDEDRWVWNDVPNNIVAVVPQFSGHIGFICEFEP